MRGKNYWNNIAKWGVLIGVIMGSSRIVESGMMLSRQVSIYALLSVEWIVVAVLYGVLLYKAVMSHVEEVYEKQGFMFFHSLNYAVVVSIFASVIVASMTYIYINTFVGGYELYFERMISSVLHIMDESQVDNSVVAMYRTQIEELQGAQIPVPTIFDTLFSAISNYIISGAVVGLIVSFVIKHRIKKISDNGE